MTGDGARTWVFPDGFCPRKGEGEGYHGHDALCIVNTGTEEARLWLDLYFEDRDCHEGIALMVPGQRSLHLRMDRPEHLGGYILPREVPYSARLRSNVPVVAQYSRLDVAQTNLALMTSLGFAVPGQG